MEQEPPKKIEYPDKERDRTMKLLAEKQWRCCPKCDWFYNQSALRYCPMCHYEWTLGSVYEQPAYESTTIT